MPQFVDVTFRRIPPITEGYTKPHTGPEFIRLLFADVDREKSTLKGKNLTGEEAMSRAAEIVMKQQPGFADIEVLYASPVD